MVWKYDREPEQNITSCDDRDPFAFHVSDSRKGWKLCVFRKGADIWGQRPKGITEQWQLLGGRTG